MTATMRRACLYRSGAAAGVVRLHRWRPLANGTSQPSAEQTIANLREQGFRVDVDEDALREVSRYFTGLAAELGLPVGVPLEYDVSVYKHQLRGGMTSTLRRQLAEIGMEHRCTTSSRKSPGSMRNWVGRSWSRRCRSSSASRRF